MSFLFAIVLLLGNMHPADTPGGPLDTPGGPIAHASAPVSGTAHDR